MPELRKKLQNRLQEVRCCLERGPEEVVAPRVESPLGVSGSRDQISEVDGVAQGVVGNLPVSQTEMVHQLLQAVALETWNPHKTMKFEYGNSYRQLQKPQLNDLDQF